MIMSYIEQSAIESTPFDMRSETSDMGLVRLYRIKTFVGRLQQTQFSFDKPSSPLADPTMISEGSF